MAGQLTPEEMDWFCKNVLPYLAVYHAAVLAGTRTAIHRQFNVSKVSIGNNISALADALARWLKETPLSTTPRGVLPSEAGRIVFDFAERILTESQSFIGQLDTFKPNLNVRVASIYSAWTVYGARLQTQFQTSVSGGTVSPTYDGGKGDYPNLITARVKNGEADVGITSYPPKVEPPLVRQRLQDSQFVIVFSSRYKQLPIEKKV